MYSVYIVENDPIILEEIVNKTAWLDNGFEVMGFHSSPIIAMREIKEKNPDAVFTDLKMPTIDGVEMMGLLMKDGVKSEFVMVSAFANFEDSRRFFRGNGFDYLLKPLQEIEVQIVLEKLAKKLSQKNRMEHHDLESISSSFLELSEYIQKEFNHKHTLESLGEKFHLNPNYICNLFSKHYNTTLTRYLTEIRMNYALEKMKNTSKSYKEIAIECGYTDYYYFSKVFKSFYGASPTKYVKNNEIQLRELEK